MIRRFRPVSILPRYFRHRPPMSGIPRTSPTAEHPAARGEYSTASPVASRGKLAALLVLLLLPGLRADTFFSEALDTSPAGWSMTGQWAFGQPAGQGGTLHGNPDPDSGYTGSNACGVNLSGDYSTAIGGPYFLTSPPIDCSGWENVHLKYRRWLNTDYPPYVDAAVEVSTDGITWTEVYHNPPSTPVSDSAWQEVDIDLSATADGAGALAIRWCYGIGQSGAYAYSGWNIDDISLTGVPVDPLAVSPADDTAFECTQGKPESVTPGSVQYSLQNTGTTVLHWSAATAEGWVEAFPPRGTLVPGGQVEVTVRLTCTAWQLPQSSVPYSSAVVFTNLSTAETTTRQAALEVSSPPAVLDIDSGEILFWVQNGGTMTRHLSVGNAAAAGGDGLQFSVTNLIRNVMTDTVGAAANTWTGTNRYRGNLYEVTADTVLTGVETWLSFTGQISLNYVVLESATRTGVYSKVADQTVARMGTGAAFYASDTLEIPFSAGHYYIVATGWTDSVGYSADTSPQPNTVSFGSQLGGYTYSGFPMPSSVSNPSTSYNNYCQRLTTGGGWLTVTPESGDLQPGDSAELVLEAAGETADTYSEGEFLIESNDPEAPEAWIRCRLATGAVVLLDIPETAREENGILAAQGCIRLPSPSAVPVQVGLVSDQPGTVAVPAHVTVPAGETAVRFDIQITDDSLPEEALTVTVTASASGYADSRDTITVRDDEPQRAEVTTDAATAAVDEEIGVTVTILNSGDEPVLDFDGSVQFGLVHPPHTVRVVSFVKYADTSATGEYQHTLDALGSYFGNYEESATSTTDPAVLTTELSSADVFLIVDQESASAGELEALGTSWSTVLSGFCESGGVVVACSGYTTQQSEHTILENSGLLSADKSGIVSSASVLRTCADPVTADVPESFTVYRASEYTNTNGTVLVESGSSGAALVIRRDVGNGAAVLIGTDFYTLGTEMDRILANAVGLAYRYRPAEATVSPSATDAFLHGTWQGTVSISDRAQQVCLAVTGPSGYVAYTQPLDVVRTLYVNSGGDDGNSGFSPGRAKLTVQAAVDAAQDGDTVVIAPGTYAGDIDFNGKAVTVTGEDPMNAETVSQTVIQGTGGGPAVTFVTGEEHTSVLAGVTVTGSAGGILCDGSSPLIHRCRICGCAAPEGAGVRCVSSPGAEFRGCTIVGNTASGDGGGLSCLDSSPVLVNCIVADNSSGTGASGGGLRCDNSAAVLLHCTVAGNDADPGNGLGGAAAVSGSGIPLISGSIVWGNTAAADDDFSGTPPLLLYSCWNAVDPGPTNISADPLFVDSGSLDFHLTASSPCLDAAPLAGAPEEDIEGQPRPYPADAAQVDMGADEQLDTAVDADADSLDDTWEQDFFGDRNLTETASGDPDGDGLTNLEEFRAGTDPTALDTDGDGLSDEFELAHGLDPADLQNPTGIQDAIDAVPSGTVITIQPGIYTEDIDFQGKSLVLRSVDPLDPAVVSATVLAGTHSGGTVRLISAEGAGTMLAGITITRAGTGNGRAVTLSGSSAVLRHCVIEGHPESVPGSTSGGLFVSASSDAVLENCTLTGNRATNGGALAVQDSAVSVWSCRLESNAASMLGGGIYCSGSTSSLALRSSIIGGNAASYFGGGICLMGMDEAPVNIDGCTIAANHVSSGSGGGVSRGDADVTMTDTIVWANTASGSGPGLYPGTGLWTVTYCCVQGGWTGDGNIGADPLFTDPATGEYHLQASSPCINAGTLSTGTPATDIDGEPRPLPEFTGRNDIGADEYSERVTVTIVDRTETAVPGGVVSYPKGSTVTFTIPGLLVEAGAAIYSFASWSGSGSLPSQGTEPVVGPVVLSTDSTLSWHWETVALLTTQAVGEGHITGTSEGWHMEDTPISLTAVPGESARFVRWAGTLHGVADPFCPSIELTVDGPLHLAALFEETPVGRTGPDSENGCIVLDVRPGWNLLSLPLCSAALELDDGSSGTLPVHPDDKLWVWDATHQSYRPRTFAELIPYQGFWWYSSGSRPVSVIVSGSLPAQDASGEAIVDWIASGWNMLGVASRRAAPLPDPFIAPVWGWDAETGGYFPAAELIPGMGYQVYCYQTPCPVSLGKPRADIDQDGLWDVWEGSYGCSDLTADTDQDGLLDGYELSEGLNPTRPDTDQDGLLDGEELLGEDPTDALDIDTDSDGLTDGWEVLHGLDPTEQNALQAAIDAASEGETILVQPGTYIITEPLTFGVKGVTLSSIAPDDHAIVNATVLQGTGTVDSVVLFNPSGTRESCLIGFTITGGKRGIEIDNASPSVLLNRVIGNGGTVDGAGISSSGGAPLIAGNRIVANRAAGSGGGVALLNDMGSVLKNNLIAGNSATGDGGGIWVDNPETTPTSSPHVTFCTLADNRSQGSGGGIGVGAAGTLRVSNSILWSNTADTSSPHTYTASGGVLDVDYCNSAEGWTGGNAYDPMFAAAGVRDDCGTPADVTDDTYTTGDYHVLSEEGRFDPETGEWERDTATSPCIDAGSPAVACLEETQPNGGTVNLGFHGNTREASRSAALPAIVLLPPMEPSEPLNIPLGGTATFGVRLSAPPPKEMAITVSIPSGSELKVRDGAEDAGELQITFAPDEWRHTQVVTLVSGAQSPAGTTVELSHPGMAPQEYVTVSVNEVDPALAPVLTGGYPSVGQTLAGAENPVFVTYSYQAPTAWGTPTVALESGPEDATSAVFTSNTAATWRIEPGSDGDYVYTLTWSDGQGGAETQTAAFSVDGIAPRTRATPAGGLHREDESVTVELTASEASLIYYSLDGRPPFVGAEGTAVYSGPLHIENTTKLQFFAVDLAGNREETRSEVYVFGTVPDSPDDLRASYDNITGDVVLSVIAPPYRVERYHVYRAVNVYDIELIEAAREAGIAPPSTLRLVEHIVQPGTLGLGRVEVRDSSVPPGAVYRYAVTAVDLQGHESGIAASFPVEVPADTSPATEEDARERAFTWLLANQSRRGDWDAPSGPRYLAACQGARALALAGDSPALRAALFHVRGNVKPDNRHLAEAILVLSRDGTPVRDLATRLKAGVFTVIDSGTGNPEMAGWGLEQYYIADPVTTPKAVLALRQEGSHLSAQEAYGIYSYPSVLASSGNTDEYAWTVGGTPCTFVTALNHAARRLTYYEEGQYYCVWPNTSSLSYGTVLEAAAILLWSPPQQNRQELVDFVLERQSTDGSWEGDPFTTALCVEAVWGSRDSVAATVSHHAPDEPAVEDLSAFLAEDGAEIRFAPELLSLAQKLGHDPGQIYAWVANSIEYDSYVYSRKGALGTLRTGKGNSWDQCSLLIALLRISGVAARYAAYSPTGGGTARLACVEARLTPEAIHGIPHTAGEVAWVPLVPYLQTARVDVGETAEGAAVFWEMGDSGMQQVELAADAFPPVDTDSDDLFDCYSIPQDLGFSELQNKLTYLTSEDSAHVTALEDFERRLQVYLTALEPGRCLADLVPDVRCRQVMPTLVPSVLPTNVGLLDLAPSPTVSAIPPTSMRETVVLELYRGGLNGQGQPAGERLIQEELILPEIADRRLTVDFTEDGSGLRPVFRLDGEIVAASTADALTAEELFTLVYSSGAEERVRPPHRAGSIVCLNFGLYGASVSRGGELRRELGTLSPSSAVPVDSGGWAAREAYVGRVGALLANQYFLRWQQAIERAYDLHGCGHDPGRPFSSIQVYVSPETVVPDGEYRTPFGFRAGWSVDTQLAAGTGTKLGYDDAPPLAWSDEFTTSIRNLYMFDSSHNESMIFEDWQGTHGLSTVGGLVWALQTGGEVTEISKEGDYYAIDTWKLNGTTLVPSPYTGSGGTNLLSAVELIGEPDGDPAGLLTSGPNPYSYDRAAAMLSEIPPTGTLIAPTNRVVFEYTDEDSSNRTLAADVYICESPDSVGFLFSLDPVAAPTAGGGTDWAYDPLVVADQGMYFDINSFFSSPTEEPPGWVDYIPESWSASSESVIRVDTEQTVNTANYTVVSSDGDPVNLTDGEFYHDSEPDIAVRSTGFDLSIRRKYRSQLGYNGPFGVGWAWNHAERIFETGISAGSGYDGNVIHYHTADRTIHTIRRLTAGGFEYPPGTTYCLEELTGGGWEIHRRDLITITFDADGFLIGKRDRNGNTLAFNRATDGSGRLLSIEDRFGRKLQFTYGAASGKIEKALGPAGRACFYLYGASAYTTFVAMLDAHDPGGRASAKLSAALQRVIDAEDTVTTFQEAVEFLGSADDLVAFADPAGSVTTYQYLQLPAAPASPMNHNLCRYTLPNGDYLQIGYYGNDTVSYHENAEGETFNFAYSFYHRYAETWNEKGWYRKVYWNGNHDVVRMDAKDGCIETMTYDPNTHDMLSSTDANGHETTFTYDGRRNLTSRSKGGETWTYTYVYASGTPTEADFYRVTRLTVADPRGNATVSDFDVNGNLVDLTGPEIYGVTHRLHRTYDQYGNPDVTIHQQSTNGIDYSSVPNASTDNTYDATLPCLLTQQEDGYGAVTSFAYDGSGLNRIGLLTRVEDAADSNVHSSYNELGQPVRVTVVTEETADDGTLPATEYEYDSNHRLVATTDPALAVTQTIYGVSRDIVTGAQVAVSIDPYGYSTRFDYDAVGSLVRRTDRRGSTTTFTHDARGRVRSRTDALGNLTRYRYDGKGNLTAVTDAGGNTTSYTYDYADRRTGETDAAGNRVTYAYDLNGNLETVTRVTDPQGSTPWNVVTVFEYDESNRRTSRTVFGDADRDGVWDAGEDGRKWEWEYDALGRRTRETDPEEHYSRWCYDSDGALPSLGMDEADSDGRRYAFTPDPASPGRNVLELRFRKAEGASPDLIAQTVTEFDSRGLVRCTRDANGNATTFRYDAARRLTARTDPLGTRTEYEYDVVGNLIATRTIENYGEQDERLLARTEFAYNLRREQISRTRCLLNETGSIIERRTEAISHDPNGNPEARIDERGELWTSHFDALNRNIAGADPLGNLAVRGYDPVGNLTYTLDPLDNITEYAYDARNLVTAAIDPVGNTVKNEYDELGRHTRTRTVRDSQYPNLDIVTRTDYDPFGDPAAVTRADGVGANIESLTEYTRDGLGRVTRILADQDQSTALEYDVTFDRDAAGRVIRETDSDNSDAEYEYDAAGNLVFETGRSGQVIGRVYDAGGRVTDIYTFPAGTRPASPAEIPTDPDGTLRQHFEYDGLGRITAATDYNGTGTGDDHTVEYVYNSLSELIEEIQDGTVVTVRYDERSDPVGLDYPSGAMLDITRDERGLPTDFQYDRGTGGVQVAAIGYDAAGRLQSVHFGSGVDLDRDLDPRSLELGRSYDRSGPVLTVAGGTAATAYDERGNLLHEAVSGQIAAGAQTVRGFTYDERSRLIGQDDDGDQTADVTWALDKLGNWTATNQNGSAETRTVNADNEYATLDAFIPVYDDNGNLLQPDSWTTCEYDWADRLVSVTIVSGGPLAPVSVTCTYDALNRRVTRTAATVTTRYVYSGSQVVEEYEDEVLARRFVPGPGLDQPILMDNVSGANAGSYYYLRNRQGSVLALTDVDGNVVESYCYSAYGTPTLFDSSGQVLAQSAYGNPYGYTGRRRDPESALWYYRNRYYSDRLGRFLTRDPAGYVDGLDLYQYALGNPLAYTDPWGLSAKAGFSYWGVANAISSPVGALAGALVDRASAATDRAASQFLQSDIPGTNALAAYLAANAEMQRQIGGAAAGMLQPVRAAEAGYNRFTGNYQLARETGSSIPGALYYSSQMSFNPMVGMAEGATGRVLSQPESFNTELSGFVERFGRASTSLGETLFTVAGGLELYRMGFPAPRSRVGYHATDPDVAPLIEQNGFRQGTAPGRLGSHGTYVNSTPEGAIAEFTAHNPGKTPAVLKVKYSPGVEAVTDVAPVKYVDSIPLNVDSVTAPSVRLPSTTNTNVFNGTVQVLERVQ